MFLIFSILFSKNDGIFSKYYNDHIVIVNASGSSKQHFNGSLQMTKPEFAVDPVDKRYDWCSNCGQTYDEHPWITFSLKNRRFSIHSYYLRIGCCYTGCCCEGSTYCAQCCLYSWSLQISDDNKTWTDIHKIEKDNEMRMCNSKTYKLDKTYTAQYIRLIQNENCPGDPPCLALNKVEFYGETIEGFSNLQDDFAPYNDDDDDVSIIGHISKSRNVYVD